MKNVFEWDWHDGGATPQKVNSPLPSLAPNETLDVKTLKSLEESMMGGVF